MCQEVRAFKSFNNVGKAAAQDSGAATASAMPAVVVTAAPRLRHSHPPPTPSSLGEYCMFLNNMTLNMYNADKSHSAAAPPLIPNAKNV